MRSKYFVVFSALAIFAMLVVSCGPAAAPEAGEGAAPAAASKDPTTWVETTFGDVDTLEGALAYDTASGEPIQNIYDNLVFFKKDSAVDFVPMIASEVPSLENGGISADGTTYTFKIREGVTFHDGTPLTVDDVAFTFVRGLLFGGTASPQWMFVEPLYGAGLADISEIVEAAANGADLADPDSILSNYEGLYYDDRAALAEVDPAVLQAVCEDLKTRIVADEAAGTVTFKTVQPWAPFLATFAGGGWGGIKSQAWVAANGGWDGDCTNWVPYYGWTSEETNETPLGSTAMGSGPYMFESWVPGEELVMKANENYWMDEALWEGAPVGPAALKTVIIKQVPEFSTRLAMAQAGDADNVLAGSTEDWPILDELVAEEGTYADWLAGEPLAVVDEAQPFRKVSDVLVVNARTDLGFNFKINVEGGNTLTGSGKLDGDGINPEFFSDVHIRRAFNYCFDYDLYLEDVLQGEGARALAVMLPGMSGYPDEGTPPQYEYDIEKCQAELAASEWTTCSEAEKDAEDAAAAVADYVEPEEADAEAPTLAELEAAAADAEAAADACEPQPISEVGFRFSMTYNTGNVQRQTIAELMQAGMQEAGEQYQVEVVGLPWPTFLRMDRANKLPARLIGWQSDYYDTHNWAFTFTAGYYSFRMRFPADVIKEFATITGEGVGITDPVARDKFYKEEFNTAYYDLTPAILLFHVKQRHYEPLYVNGWYANPMYSNNWYYVLSKD